MIFTSKTKTRQVFQHIITPPPLLTKEMLPTLFTYLANSSFTDLGHASVQLNKHKSQTTVRYKLIKFIILILIQRDISEFWSKIPCLQTRLGVVCMFCLSGKDIAMHSKSNGKCNWSYFTFCQVSAHYTSREYIWGCLVLKMWQSSNHIQRKPVISEHHSLTISNITITSSCCKLKKVMGIVVVKAQLDPHHWGILK